MTCSTLRPRPRQVITVFIGSFIAGTFANQLDQFINDPGAGRSRLVHLHA